MGGKLEQDQHARPLSLKAVTAITGFFGGIFWGAIGWLFHIFHFTELQPSTILEPWAAGDWKYSWQGSVISLIFLGLIGIFAAFIYYYTLKRFQNVWTGILYGVVLFAIVFFLLNPLFPSLNDISKLSVNTIITTLCLYILFGLFVGYSISYEYNEQMMKEALAKKDEK